VKHKVICGLCGKSEIIEIPPNGKIPNRWRYYGKLNVNACQTSKFYYKFPEGFPKKVEDWDKEKIKVPNKCYDPKVKPKYIELWFHAKCDDKAAREQRKRIRKLKHEKLKKPLSQLRLRFSS